MSILASKRNRDYLGGALMMVLGIGAAAVGSTYQMGTLSRMGPGYFPTALGVILTLTGAAIAAGAWFARPEAHSKVLPPEWRGWICICASVIAFVVLGKYGGLVPATFAVVFISALGDRENTWKSAAVLAAGIVVVCLIVFWWALQMTFPLFTWG